MIAVRCSLSLFTLPQKKMYYAPFVRLCLAVSLAAVSFSITLASAGDVQVRWEQSVLPAGGAKGAVELTNGDVLASRTAREEQGMRVICSRSRDAGRSWQVIATIVRDDDPQVDIGDGHLLQRANGQILYCHRHNKYRGQFSTRPSFSINVAASQDGGQTWVAHSTVERLEFEKGAPPSRGLWSSFLLERTDGTLQCYYDDENTPLVAGFPGHQWLRMKTWDAASSTWTEPVTVSRAFHPKHLSRDGMASVVELPGNRLFCALESCDVTPPHANVIRYVTSDDGGRTWSWCRRERDILFRSAEKNFMAVAPWLARLDDDLLVCVFATDEDREVPDKPATPVPKLNMDVKCVFSTDGGRSWSKQAQTVYADSHKSYMPGVLQLTRGPAAGSLIVFFHDMQHGYLARRGSVVRFSENP